MFSDSRAPCLRTADLRFTRRPVTRALARAGHDAIHIDAGPPLPENRPQVMLRLGAACTSCDTVLSSPKGLPT